MKTRSQRAIDPEILSLKGALYDTLPPPRPLHGRAVDHDVLGLPSGLFDTLPPPPPISALRDSLTPIVDAERRISAPPPMLPVRRIGFAQIVGVSVAVAMMATAIGLRRDRVATPAAAPAVPTITLPEVLILGDLQRPALPEVGEPAPATRSAAPPSLDRRAAPRAAAAAKDRSRDLAPREATSPPDDLAVALAAIPREDRALDRADAARALARAAQGAKGCLDEGEARTTMSVSVTFAPSGNVTAAKITGGPFMGTSTGGCVARALRAASVRPFAGEPVVINTSVHIR